MTYARFAVSTLSTQYLHYLLSNYTIYSVTTLSTLSTDRYPGVGCEPHPGVAGVLALLAQLLLQVGVDKLHAAPPALCLTPLPLRPLTTTLVTSLVTPLVTPLVSPLVTPLRTPLVKVTPLPLVVVVVGVHTDGGHLVWREGGVEAAQGHAVYH